ncbi:MAG TPA: zinc-finger domain-containing protein, partial [Ottowia sp.]|nr:zinc-finger domain-containing protein [Ottowia sp.]
MSQTFVELLAKDLTRSGKTYCPNPKAGMEIWNTHPRVFLDPKAGEAKCPYCGTVYR